jgi:ribosome-binding protein aMBF1 (putative translation factor)
MQNWTQFKTQLLKNPQVKDSYHSLKLQYEMADQVITFRKQLKITQADLAKKMKTTQSAVARFESARQTPSLKFLTKLANSLDKKLEIRFLDK